MVTTTLTTTATVNVVSLFCGCGGSSLGYERAGCKVLLASDFNPRALRTYRLNFPHTPTLQADIRRVNAAEIKSAIGNETEIDILDGSPPCTPFSMAGKREKGWNRIGKHTGEHVVQRTDDLFFEYIRLIGELQPKTFIAENVSGLIKGRAKDYYNRICEGVKTKGYKIKPFLLDAADFEVPQIRKRVVIVGVRNDIKPNPNALLKKHKHVSFIEAIRGIRYDVDDVKRANCMLTAKPYLHYVKQGESIGRYHPKGSWFNYQKAKVNEPSPTITAHWTLIHPIEDRLLTISEFKRCASFPDSFAFLSLNDAQIMIGNSVPPNLIKNVALYVITLAGLGRPVDPPSTWTPAT